jgi:N-acetyl-gamma-glutamyl-phosphate reductase
VHVKIIDLSQDFRLKENATFGNREFVYGLVEYNRKNITEAKNIANPGCFATAIQLGLLPLTNFTGLYRNECFTSGITGSTGAGQSLTPTSHFSWRANNIQAYKVLSHQHVFEIHETLDSCSNWGNADIKFIPYRGDFTRGIYITSAIHNGGEFDNSIEEYKNYYKDCPFVTISDTPIDLKQVVNTNKCLIYIEFSENDLIIHSVIDNLLKGASGQAVQNMNLMFGLNETTGLKLKANYF